MAISISENDRLLTEKEAAKFLGFSVKTLQSRRYYQQEPVFIKLSDKAVRYRLSDLLAWLDRCTIEPRNAGGAA